MSEGNSTVSGGRIGFCGLLTLLFVGLKLTHYIDWSWWFVLAPLWMPLALVLGVAVIGLLIAFVFVGLSGK